MNRIGLTAVLAVASVTVADRAAHAIVIGQVEDFQNGSWGNWGGGDSLTVPTPGPLGASDRYLHFESFGGSGQGSKLAANNGFLWAGDYATAGVTKLAADFLNPNTSPVATTLNMRIVLFGPLGSRWTSTVGSSIVADSQWHHVNFSLAQSDLTEVSGTETYAQVMSNVAQLQIRYDAGASPSSGGTTFAGTLGLDNLTAVGDTTASLTWNNAGGVGDGTTWDLSNPNWSNGATVTTFHDRDTVTFNDANNGHYNVTPNGSITSGPVVVNNSGGDYAFAGAGGIAGGGDLTKLGTRALTISTANTFTGGTFVAAGSLTLMSSGSLAGNALTVANGAAASIAGSLGSQVTVNADGALNFAGNTTSTAQARRLTELNIGPGGTTTLAASTFPYTPLVLTVDALSFADSTAKLDLGNNELLVSDTLTNAVAAIVAGRIVTTSAGGGLGTFALINGQTEVRFTLLGDTNLDGKVDVTDLGNLASNYGATSAATWVRGDTNYDGAVDVTDLGNLASNYGGQLAAGPSALVAVPSAAVPEPTAAAAGLLFSLLGAQQRRRRA